MAWLEFMGAGGGIAMTKADTSEASGGLALEGALPPAETLEGVPLPAGALVTEDIGDAKFETKTRQET